jgi:hypothetical protein
MEGRARDGSAFFVSTAYDNLQNPMLTDIGDK